MLTYDLSLVHPRSQVEMQDAVIAKKELHVCM